MGFCDVTNAEVFALTRQRRQEAAERRRRLNGETFYFFGTSHEFDPAYTKGGKRNGIRKKRPAAPLMSQPFLSEDKIKGRLKRLYDLQGGDCYICEKPFTADFGATEDHVVPKALGGKNDKNILLAHAPCNHKKGDRMPSYKERRYLASVNYAIERNLSSVVDVDALELV